MGRTQGSEEGLTDESRPVRSKVPFSAAVGSSKTIRTTSLLLAESPHQNEDNDGMRTFVFSAATFIAIGMMGCAVDENQASLADPSRQSASPTPCVEGTPVTVKVRDHEIEIPKVCPSSEPRAVGFTERVQLGSVLAALPCKELPDFAGSFWRVAPPYPKHLAMLGHDFIPGRMTLVSPDEARFTAKAIRMHMGDRSEGTMRLPAKGRLNLTFEPIEGPVAVGACD